MNHAMANRHHRKTNRPFAHLSLALAFLCLAAPAAHAAKEAPSEMTSFISLDTNRDGFIDREEAAISTTLSEVFDEIDKNKDGLLSPGEYTQDFSLKS